MSNKKKAESGHEINYMHEALTITIIYCVFGIIWILISDKILSLLITDSESYIMFQTIKGWSYVVITAILIYSIVAKRMKIIKDSNAELIKTYEEIKNRDQELGILDDKFQYQKDLTQNIIDASQVVICVWDNNGIIKKINYYGTQLFGYSKDELIGRKWADVFFENENNFIATYAMEEIKHQTKGYNYEGRFISKEGKEIDLIWNSVRLRNSEKDTEEYVSIGVDITDRKEQQEKIKYMTLFDKLTGLPNKSMFELEVENIISNGDEKVFYIVYIDIDNFKYINDLLGHQVGDVFLKYMGDILKIKVAGANFIARISGDEFAVIITEEISAEDLVEKIKEMKEYFGKKWKYKNYQFYISMSVGVSVFPENGDDINELLKNAEIAMYAAKKQGDNKILIYKDDLIIDQKKYTEMSGKIQSGKDNREFELYYQPQYDINAEKIIGIEALIRWNHKGEEYIPPDVFIPIAEETGQIYDIELWIFDTALSQKKIWEEQGIEKVQMSINLSAKMLISQETFDKLEILIKSYDINYSELFVEITETAILDCSEIVIERLNKLKNIGLKIALDDFETGYSSFYHIKELPIDAIKLDKCYIASLLENEKNTAIIRALLILAKDLNFGVIAEGVENKEQIEYLKQYFCQGIQGNLFSEALSVENTTKLLKEFQ